MIVDEVQTGAGATGSFWASDKWNLSSPPDFLTFSKKMCAVTSRRIADDCRQAAGFYHTSDTRAGAPYRNCASATSRTI